MRNDARKRRLQSLVTWVLTAGVATYVVLRVDWAGLPGALAEARWGYLLLALAVTLAGNLFIGPDRWRLILSRLGCRVSLRQAVFVKVAGGPVKFALPMKAGELFRAFYLSRYLGHNLERCLSSVLMEKVANMLSAGVFLLAGLLLSGIGTARWWALGVTAAFLAVFLSRGGRRLVGEALDRVSGGLARRFRDAVSALAELSLGEKALIFLYSLVFTLTELFIAFFSFRALGMRFPLVAFFMFTPVSVLLSIPTMSGIGLRELAAERLFSPEGLVALRFGLTAADCGTDAARVTAGFLVTVIYYLFVPIVGLPWLKTFLHRSVWKTAKGESDAGAERVS